MFRRYALFIIAFFTYQIMAQENIPVTDNVQIEVQTPSLMKYSKAQRVIVNITCNTWTTGQEMHLRLSDATGIPVPISITRNNEPLWMIQSEKASDNTVVMSWQVTEDNILILFPGNWSTPFDLNLEMQISLVDIINLENTENTRLDLFLVTGGSELLAETKGRGNEISLKNTRE